ncbi:MAG: GNAT family N-acetyltransferase [Flavobacteriales bacterium]
MLRGENLVLRALEPSDLNLIYNWENDQNIWKVSQTFSPFSKHTLSRYLENAHQDIFITKQLRLIIEINKIPIGTIELFDFDPFHLRAGIGIWIVEDTHRRKGYAKEALNIVLDYAFNILHLNLIYCNISARNNASINLFSALDFVIVGVKKKWNKTPEGWEDELLFQRLCG